MTEVKFYDSVADDLLRVAVIIARSDGKCIPSAAERGQASTRRRNASVCSLPPRYTPLRKNSVVK